MLNNLVFAILLHLQEPTRISVEFDNVIYVCYHKIGAIKMTTTMNNTATFLNVLGKLSDVFFVREKHQQYQLKTPTGAIDLTRNYLDVILSDIQNIKENNNNTPKTLNGPEGSISDKICQSIKLLNCGLNQLRCNVLHYGDLDMNLLSCMTSEHEHLHSTFNHS